MSSSLHTFSRTMRKTRTIVCAFQPQSVLPTSSQRPITRLSAHNSTRNGSTQHAPSNRRYLSLSNPLQASNTDNAASQQSGASTDASVNKSHYPDDEHVLDKGDTLDIQSRNSVEGRESRAQDKGGHATAEKDVRSTAAKAKKEFPEAPDTVIGMQDERGGKGY